MVQTRALVIKLYYWIRFLLEYWICSYQRPTSELVFCLPESLEFRNGGILKEPFVWMEISRKILAAGKSAETQCGLKGSGKEKKKHLAPKTSNRKTVHILWASCFFCWLYSFIQQIFYCALFPLPDTKDTAGNKSVMGPAFTEPLLSFPFPKCIS